MSINAIGTRAAPIKGSEMPMMHGTCGFCFRTIWTVQPVTDKPPEYWVHVHNGSTHCY